jgi:hypothetical protein
MKKMMWFSRHPLTDAQLADVQALFGPVEVNQIDRTIKSAYEISSEIEQADLVAIVAPLNLQDQFLKLSGEKPVLICRNHRVVNPDGSVQFHHGGWSRLRKVEIVIDELSSIDPPPEAETIR